MQQKYGPNTKFLKNPIHNAQVEVGGLGVNITLLGEGVTWGTGYISWLEWERLAAWVEWRRSEQKDSN